MFGRLDQLESRYEDLGRQLALPKSSPTTKYQKIAKQHRDLDNVVEKYREYKHVKTGISDAEAMLAESDPHLRAMAAEELTQL